MRQFQLHRDIDESGVSGTGIVAEGVVFQDGRAAMRWRTETASTAVYESVEDLEAIHGHGGLTRLVYISEDPATAIREFPWWDYGMDDVGEVVNVGDWVDDLAKAITGHDWCPPPQVDTAGESG